MREKLALVLCGMLLVCRFLSSSMQAYGEEGEADIRRMAVWVAIPADYDGESDLYLCSSLNPEGMAIGSGSLLYRDKEWILRRLYVDGLQADEYWVSVSTAKKGGLPGNAVGRAFPDMERRSLLPEIDTSVASLYMEADPQEPPSDALLTVSELTGIQAAGCPQFFCIFGTIETIDGYLAEIEGIFERLILAYATQVRDTYGFDTMLRRLTPWSVTYGHFHDYVGLFRPLGVSLEEYADMAYNRALQMFSPESNPWEPVGAILSTWCIEEPEGPDSVRAFENDPATILKGWGWEIYYDVSDASILKYDEFGNCITDFQFHSDGAPVHVRIPALDGSTPPSGGNALPIIGEVPGLSMGSALTPGASATPGGQETVIQSFPSAVPGMAGDVGQPDGPDGEVSVGSRNMGKLGLPAAIAIICILGIGIFLFRKKKR